MTLSTSTRIRNSSDASNNDNDDSYDNVATVHIDNSFSVDVADDRIGTSCDVDIECDCDANVDWSEQRAVRNHVRCYVCSSNCRQQRIKRENIVIVGITR